MSYEIVHGADVNIKAVAKYVLQCRNTLDVKSESMQQLASQLATQQQFLQTQSNADILLIYLLYLDMKTYILVYIINVL